MRVALLTNILTPYRLPVYRALARTPGWELRILLSAESEFDRDWCAEAGDLDVEVVRGVSLRRRLRTRGRAPAEQLVTRHLPFGLPAALRRFRPDVVVSAELGARTALALAWSRARRVPLVIWTYPSRASATAAGPWLRGWRRCLLAGAAAVIGMGRQAREVLEGLGVPPGRLFDAPNAHDHEGCAKAVAGLDAEALRDRLQLALGCRERIALCAGRMVPVKGIPRLLEAWDRLPAAPRAAWTLLFVGSGPLTEPLRAAAAARERGELLHLPGRPPHEVYELLAAADLLVFPSLGDTWGLVVNEAMACGTPVLCSQLAGCADDLVRPGENGWLCDPTDAAGFARALCLALEHPDLPALGRRARETAERFRPEVMAAGMRRAIQEAAGGSR